MAEKAELLIDRYAEQGEPEYVTAYAILRLRDEIKRVATALEWIGMRGPADSMGALEFLGKQVERLADAAETKE